MDKRKKAEHAIEPLGRQASDLTGAMVARLLAEIQAEHQGQGAQTVDSILARARSLQAHAETANIPASERAAALNTCAVGFAYVFERRHCISDLDEAIATWRSSLGLVRRAQVIRGGLLANLARAIYLRYLDGHESADFHAAVRSWRRAIAATEADSPLRRSLIGAVHSALYDRYLTTGQLSDLRRVIDAVRSELAARMTDDDLHARLLDTLGQLLVERYRRSHSLANADAAVESLTARLQGGTNRAADLVQAGANFRASYKAHGDPIWLDLAIRAFDLSIQADLVGLNAALANGEKGGALRARYRLTHKPSDIARSISAYRQAVSLAFADPVDRARNLNNLSGAFESRYLVTHQPRDCAFALSSIAASLALTPADSPLRARRLQNLGHCQRALFDVVHRPADLDAAIEAYQEGLKLLPEDSEDRAIWLEELGQDLRSRFELTASVTDLVASIDACRNAILATADKDPAIPQRVDQLVARLVRCHHLTGSVQDLNEAIAADENLLATTEAPASILSKRLARLGTSLFYRHGYTHSLADLERSIIADRRALELAGEGEERAWRLSGLAADLRQHFEVVGSEESLTEATHLAQEGLDLLPKGDPNRALVLNNSANCLRGMFAITRDAACLTGAIARSEEAISISNADDLEKVRALEGLAIDLTWRHDTSAGDGSDIDRVITCHLQALSLLTPSTSLGPIIMGNLAGSYRTRYERTGNAADLDASIRFYRSACEEGRRLGAGLALAVAADWSRWAGDRGSWIEATEASEFGLEAVDELVRVQSARAHKELFLRDADGLSAQSAYAWARTGDHVKAVVSAERGRGVLLAEALRTWQELRQLEREGHVELVRRFQELAAARSAVVLRGVAELSWDTRHAD